MDNRNHLISFLQAFGIILVVGGHSVPHTFAITRWIYSFHMPLFLLISGYLLLYVPKIKQKKLADQQMTGSNGFLMKKMKRLLIPYVVISTIAFFPKSYLSTFAERPIDLSFSSWIHMLAYPWDNAIIFFWFLPTLFFIMCIVMYTTKAIDKVGFRIPLSLTIVILIMLALLNVLNPLRSYQFLNIGGIIHYLFYFVMGMFYCEKQNSIHVFLKKSKYIVFIVSFALSFLYLLYRNNMTDLLFAMNGIIMSISLGYIYVVRGATFLRHLDGASYAIYLFSWFPQIVVQKILPRFIPLTDVLIMLLAFIAGLYIPYLIYLLIVYLKKNYRWGKLLALLTGQ